MTEKGEKKELKGNEDLVQKRFLLIKKASKGGNISQACREAGIDRTSFYLWKRRFEAHGLNGLSNKKKIPRKHPKTTPPEVEEKILKIVAKFPNLACFPLSLLLQKEGICISSPTVQKILVKNKLGNKEERYFAFEEVAQKEKFPLSPSQISSIEKWNPAFKERHRPVGKPGELLIHGCFFLGMVPGLGNVFVQAIVDAFSLFSFAIPYLSRRGEFALAILHNETIPFYRERKIAIKTILTDRKPEYYEPEGCSYQRFLKLNMIEQKICPSPVTNKNGFFERFQKIILKEFYRPFLKKQKSQSLEKFQMALDHWLHWYNFERLSRGFPNMGKRPNDAICECLERLYQFKTTRK
ncbi:MAG: helix-turn-helix domain-containing protein [Candidatus Riflebacteria bacterium]|nr:helix-turn-helix domain-containing protein [Candidatus Riflebacteria bacterium]